jgi:hypothetical protein
MIAVFIGIGLVWKEVERRSIYSLLSKPLSRAEFILASILRSGVDPAAALVMVVAWYVVLAYMATTVSLEVRAAGQPATDRAARGGADPRELMLVTAIASSRPSRPFLSAGFTLGLWVVGTSTRISRTSKVVDSRAAVGARALLRAAELLGVRHQTAGRYA